MQYIYLVACIAAAALAGLAHSNNNRDAVVPALVCAVIFFVLALGKLL